MASWSFNPFTGNLDLVGSGGGAVVFEGEVATFADLPVTIGDPAVGAAFLVRDSTGVWLVNRRQAGIYIRRNNAGLSTDWEYGGDYPVNSVNNQSGNVVLAAADVGAAASTHASTHITGGTDALAAHQINGQTIFSASSATYSSDQTLLANRARQLVVSNTNASGITLTMPTQAEGTLLGDTYVIVGGNTISGPITVRGVANLSPLVYTTLVTITAMGQQYRLRSSGGSSGGWSLIPVDTHNHAAADITSGTFDNARINWAAPSAIGSTTRNTGAFTTLTANNGTPLTASAPVLDLAQTWNNAAVAFTALRLDITNTASLSAGSGGSRFFDIRIGGTSQIRFERNFSTPVLYFGSTDTGIGAATTVLNFYANGGAVMSIGSGAGGPIIRSDSGYSWSSASNVTSAVDLSLGRDGAYTLAQRVGTNAQTFNIYNTFTSSTNHERGFLRWSSNVFQIGTEKGSGGGTARALEFQTDGVSRLAIDSTGIVTISNTTASNSTTTGALQVVGGVGVGGSVQSGANVRARDFRLWNTASIFTWESRSITLASSAAGSLEQYSGTTPQSFRIYNTVSGTNNVNFDRVNFRWASNEFIIDAEAGGTGTLRGIKIGSATSSLLGFYGVTPVDQPATVADPAGGGTIDTEARTAINDIIDRLQELGLIA